MKNREYIITLKVSVNHESDLNYDDFVYRAIEEQLERGEDIVSYNLEEVTGL